MSARQPHANAQQALQRLRQPTASERGLESTGSEAPNLSGSRIVESLERARERLRRITERAEGQARLTEEQQRVLDDARAALERMSADGEQADLSNDHLIGLEAVVVPDGTRPALFVQDGTVDPGSADAGQWSASIADVLPGIRVVAPSVGRLNADRGFASFAGTAFVVGPGLLMTNRHVLELLAGGPDPRPDGTWAFRTPVTIDFAAEFQRDRRRRFEVTGVAFASDDRIRGILNPANLDVALLTVVQHNGEEALPPPLPLSRRLVDDVIPSSVYVMGYPAKPLNALGEVMRRIFGDEYAVKRFAPALVKDSADAFDDGGHKRVFTHDGSTLGGNSGSCVVEFRADARPVVGLHFGGTVGDRNFAHALARVEPALAEHGVSVAED